MKKVIRIALFIGVCFMGSSQAQEKSFYIVADDDFPPFSFVEDHQLHGIDIEIINEMSRRIDLPIRVALMPWKRLMDMTLKGHCDGSMSLFETEKRKRFAYFTAPIHYSTYVIFVHKDRMFEFLSIKDLFGKILCKQAGFVISDEFDRAVQRKQIKIVDIYDSDTSILRVVNGQVDGVVANKQVTLYKLNSNLILAKLKDQLTILPKPVKEKRGAYFVISKASTYPNKLVLMKKITATLKTMEQDGTYAAIYNRYLK